jgi:glycerophosphoryl diester phosphodiesterase
MTARGFVRIAHGGGGSLAAPNSLEGVKRSLEFGVDMVEIDVRCTRDGVLVLSHDDGLGGSLISGSSLDELRRAHPDVATLDDALALVNGRAVLNLDIKDVASIKCVGAAVRARGGVEQCVVSCLKRAWLLELGELEPSIPTYLSYPADRGGASQKPWLKPVVSGVVSLMRLSLRARLPGMVGALPAAGVTLYHPLVTPRIVRLVHDMGMALYTWTVDDTGRMAELIAMGVDGITSNRPDLLAELAVERPSADAVLAR